MRIIKKNKLTWIDVLRPTKKDIEFIRKQHRFHPIILDELLHSSARSRVEPYDKYLFLTYHLPIYDKNVKSSRKLEVDFLITKDKVITIHYEDVEPINNFWRRLSNDKNFKDQALNNTGILVYFLIEEILAFSQRQLRHIEESVSDISKELFKKKEAQLLQRISYLKRNILEYSIISNPQKIILESLRDVGGRFWHKEMRIYLSDLVGDHLKIMQHLDNYKETVDALEQTNSQLLNAKTNAVMQKFTVMAFLTIPLVLLTQIFGADVVNLQINNDPSIFWGSFFLVLIISVIMLLFFKWKDWL